MRKKIEELDLEAEAQRDNDIYAKANKIQNEKAAKATNGKVVLLDPVHSSDLDVKIINPEAKFKEKIYQVKGSRKEFRQFDGNKHRHCGGCPHPDGCIMCTLK